MPLIDQTIRICLMALPEKELALLTRVINFSQRQGKPYVLQDSPDHAQMLVVMGDMDASAWQLNKLILRIANQSQTAEEQLLKPPLLVTRVMRTLDDAAQLVAQRPSTTATVSHQLAQNDDQQTVASITNTATAVSDTPHEVTEPSSPASATLASEKTETSTAPIENAVQSSADSNVSTSSPTPDHTPKINMSRYNALVVDDSFAIRKQLEIELRRLGIGSDMAEDGEDALNKVNEQNYDLIFLDVVMPGIDGYEVCKALRKRPSTRKTPIIMLSGKDSPLDEVQGVLAGATTYLTKPVKHERLEQTIKRVTNWLAEYAKY